MTLMVKDLLFAINQAAPIAQTNSRFPVLRNVLLRNGQVIASNIDNYAFISVDGLHLSNQVSVDAAVLQKALKSFRKCDDLILTTDDHSINLNGLQLETQDPGEFPTTEIDIGVEESDTFSLNVSDLITVNQAASKDENRPQLMGVNVDLGLKEIAASNGHMLIAKPITYAGKEPYEKRTKGIISSEAIRFLKYAKGAVIAQFFRHEERTENNQEPIITKRLMVSTPSWSLFSKCSFLDFPDYKQVVPKTVLHEMPLDCTKLSSFLANAKTIAVANMPQYVGCTIANSVARLEYKSPKGTISCNIPTSTIPTTLRFGLDVKYLDIVNNIADKYGKNLTLGINVTPNQNSFEVLTAIKVLSLDGKDLIAAIMPTRVS